jgi:hypothetical protein
VLQVCHTKRFSHTTSCRASLVPPECALALNEWLSVENDLLFTPI